MSATMLLHIDPTRPSIVQTDTFDFSIGTILSQPEADGTTTPRGN